MARIGVQKVAAYILRENHRGVDELLVFAHKGFSKVPLQVPGGTVEPHEELETAVNREIFEESGLKNLEYRKKLGSTIYFRSDLKQHVQRHDFLFRAPRETRDHWEHTVSGHGEDEGMTFFYQWFGAKEVLKIHSDFHLFLNDKKIPSLFPKTALLGLGQKEIALLSHTALWEQQFKKDKEEIERTVHPLTPKIEHIGSTAIPNIPAKPIIDIGIGVENSMEAEQMVHALQILGYDSKGEYGIEGRRYYLTKGPDTHRTHHIHMFQYDHPEWKKHLLFRDYLRSHREAAEAYARAAGIQ
ncbi:GrpB-like predicted nucleotidyltransferase (UPF0157 family)/8-oxo-dGTP pyrophosphatase MutT (NUDIX family) [Pullulanibacillus pueri]|uniref:Nudix hydrolase domain-containing protein n=1 Tax=Pullulanibacillus pueri TaxID=1437324 RepID=A0A8J2ZTV9_9BACL|nr:GrpB family protein [Pullulanibacillus pueri]MBM7681096.1 GrpB-like predicted nucleotidyltransferase (UPF0157 family)/8-oxo-dGTP pyrophosphatase MutT (NUDIX family) [Pullulanibacillus pueri]GGH77029.1 hypothetical protein GCM10007096_08320 [Pullulanibacillus pueri]